jgi:hypothetical protein
MSLEQLTLDTLGDLDGGMVRAVINRSIRQALMDTEDRGEDEKPRKVVITISFEKISDRQIGTDVTAQVRLPALRPKATIGNIVFKDGEPSVLFQTLSPDDPDQQTFPSLNEREDQ